MHDSHMADIVASVASVTVVVVPMFPMVLVHGSSRADATIFRMVRLT